jgi:hypothetical protein
MVISQLLHMFSSMCVPSSRKITFDLNNHTELIVLLVIAFVGLTIFDIFYIVVIVTYSSECQLLIYYISNIRDRVKDSSVPFDVIIKVGLSRGVEFPRGAKHTIFYDYRKFSLILHCFICQTLHLPSILCRN